MPRRCDFHLLEYGTTEFYHVAVGWLESVCLPWTLWWYCLSACAFWESTVGTAHGRSGRNFRRELDITLVLQHSDNKWQVFPLSASPVVALVLSGIWMNGYFYEEVPAVSAFLLLISLFFAPVGRIAAIQKLDTRRSAIVQIVAIALPVVIAIGIAVARSGLFGENSNY